MLQNCIDTLLSNRMVIDYLTRSERNLIQAFSKRYHFNMRGKADRTMVVTVNSGVYTINNMYHRDDRFVTIVCFTTAKQTNVVVPRYHLETIVSNADNVFFDIPAQDFPIWLIYNFVPRGIKAALSFRNETEECQLLIPRTCNLHHKYTQQVSKRHIRTPS